MSVCVARLSLALAGECDHMANTVRLPRDGRAPTCAAGPLGDTQHVADTAVNCVVQRG